MWGKFWFGPERQARDAGVRGLDVRKSGWAAPMPEQATRADKTPLTEDQAGEVAEFLARVYTHQQC
jgi:hypothetical protein